MRPAEPGTGRGERAVLSDPRGDRAGKPGLRPLADLAGQPPLQPRGGRYLLRVEDTDQARFEEGALAQFEAGFEYFGITADESDVVGGEYGPYTQSARAEIYQTYVRELMQIGRAHV